ncbi:MAG: hypothetical protein HY863_04275 [Chloroflexi bacterium]|nr:hypothetical protein [Chloroflexota bacterium]
MKLSDRMNTLLPESASAFERAQAKIVSNTSMSIGAAMLALVLYWIVTKTFEDIETIFVMTGLFLLLAGIVALVKRGYIKLGAWLLTGLMLLLNLSDMSWYGISTVASSGFIIPILLTVFSIGPNAGMGVTVLGCVSAFLIAYLASIGQLQTEIPYQESTLSFDAPTLSLIYLITGILAGNWVRSTQEAFQNKK